ncbi:hypothetical protein WJX72_004906 [[Myrmecia] bisecta]
MITLEPWADTANEPHTSSSAATAAEAESELALRSAADGKERPAEKPRAHSGSEAESTRSSLPRKTRKGGPKHQPSRTSHTPAGDNMNTSVTQPPQPSQIPPTVAETPAQGGPQPGAALSPSTAAGVDAIMGLVPAGIAGTPAGDHVIRVFMLLSLLTAGVLLACYLLVTHARLPGWVSSAVHTGYQRISPRLE